MFPLSSLVNLLRISYAFTFLVKNEWMWSLKPPLIIGDIRPRKLDQKEPIGDLDMPYRGHALLWEMYAFLWSCKGLDSIC